LFLALLAIDEFLDIAVPIFERIHLGGATGLAAGFYDVGNLVINFQEGERTAGASATAELFLAGTDGGEVGAGAGTVFEEHRFAVGQAHDVFHIIVDRLDEAGAALRVFVLGGSAFGLAGP